MARDYSKYSTEELITHINELEKQLKSSKYGLYWDKAIKQEYVVEKCKSSIPILIRNSELSTFSDESRDANILIEGDNFHALTILNMLSEGKGFVDLIYIDPPYNTERKDFVYNDECVDLDDGYRHSKWISFMDKRLRLARNLLAENGLIFISIDDNEVANLILLCNKIFGESNHVNTICVNMNSLSGVKMVHAIKGKRYPAQKEYLLVYKRTNLPVSMFIEKNHKEKWDKEYNLIIPEMKENQFAEFEDMELDEVNEVLSHMHLKTVAQFAKENNIKIDENWLWDNSFRIFGTKSNRPLARQMREKTFGHQIVCYINSDGNKRYFRGDFNRKVKDPRIELVQAEANASVFLSDNWIDISNDGGVAQEGGVVFPNGKKPLQLLKRIIRAVNKKDAVVLDFFAGSGSTGHAVLALNEEDGGARKFILCTNNENNICVEKTLKRINNVIKGYGNNSGIPANLVYYKIDFLEDSKNTDQAKYCLAEKVDEFLCIIEDTFNLVDSNNSFIHYTNCDQSKAIFIYNDYYNAATFETLKIAIRKSSCPVKIVYFYSTDNIIDEQLFGELENVTIKSIPSKIYEIYKEIKEDIKRSDA